MDVSIVGMQRREKKNHIFSSSMLPTITENVITVQIAAESMGRNRQMNSWIQQNQTQNNNMMGQAQFTPYNSWGMQPRVTLPTYHAEPIHGENAAWQFPMGPNSDIWLPDADEDLIWWIKTDANGNKSVQPFDVNPHKKPEQVDMNDILARLGAVEEWINGK